MQNKFGHLIAMDLVFQVRIKIAGVERNILAISIKEAVATRSDSEILHFIAECAVDNFNIIADLIGLVLTVKIIDYANEFKS